MATPLARCRISCRSYTSQKGCPYGYIRKTPHYKETAKGNELNTKHSVHPNSIFEAINKGESHVM